jgi:hypothetical protein
VLNYFNNDEEKARDYYILMGMVKKSNKKYMNRKFLMKLIDVSSGSML